MDNKNIDRLFQEKLKNLEATPNKRVWNNIESTLKKKKRKIVPIWWFTGGVAAILILSLLLFPFSDDKDNLNINNDSNSIITEAPKEEKEFKSISKNPIDSVIQQKNIEEKTLIADKKTNLKKIKIKDNNKKLVSTKNAMKKIFLADNLIEKKRDSLKKDVGTDKNNKIKQNEFKEIEKNTITKKVDLKKFLEKKDSIIVTKPLKNNWSVAPVFAVISSNSFSNASPIDNNLSSSTKGKSTFSYGVQVAYQINKKWTIQSGIHMQEMSFSNKQITATASISSNSSSVAFNSGGSISFENTPTQNSDFASSSSLNNASLNGELNQKYGYIEIPIEVKYNLLNSNKFNTQIVAGFSSLFLNKNNVNLNTQFLSKSGKATNLNNINFSGNFGFDFNYSLNKNWSLNLNPMFKAQLNTFSKDSNGFSPFNIGIYSGVKYRF